MKKSLLLTAFLMMLTVVGYAAEEAAPAAAAPAEPAVAAPAPAAPAAAAPAVKAAAAAVKAATAPAAPAMDPALMEKMKVLMSPTENHKALEAFVGNWDYTGKFWMTKDAPPQDMTGTAKHEMIYGGRFLKQEIEGPWMGETFHGIGYTGFDNIKQEYASVWIDSLGTGIMSVTGSYDVPMRSLKQSGANSCPLTGEKARQGRSEWTVADKDHNTYTAYTIDDGKEFKSMEIVYTRQGIAAE